MDLKALIAKLNPTCRRALEGAAQSSVRRRPTSMSKPSIFCSGFWNRRTPTSEAASVRYDDIEVEDVNAELTRSDREVLPLWCSGRTPTALSAADPMLIQEAWSGFRRSTWARIAVRSAVVFCRCQSAEHESLRSVITESAPSIPADSARGQVSAKMSAMLARASRDRRRTSRSIRQTAPPEVIPRTPPPPHHARKQKVRTRCGIWKTPALDQYTIDLTAQARAGKIDPVQGRDVEIRQIIDILTRRRAEQQSDSDQATPVWVRPPSSKDSRSALPRTMYRPRCRTFRCIFSISACCRPGPALRANSRTA